ncbi:TPA: Flp pilus assembly complex ATPase component TadA [Escherichia coli]|nr:nucleotide-binding protein [Salmonella enterica]EFD4965973.1 nucleotide-binding protein [Escherichia coli]EFK0327422.1 Flp pilus assembly complex ATPase component [Escherichia coli]EFM4848407.1 Flp pilus assembly complex ATPase component [Escherichia coli]HDZ7461296.1 Flp pilus assembly complex ATPase component TadA [Escherichia coli]
MVSNTDIPDGLRHLVQVLPAAAGKPGHRVCFPVTETSNPEIQTFITGLLRTTGQPVIPEPVSPEEFRNLQNDAGDALRHDGGEHSRSEVQTRVLNMFREARRVGASDIHITVCVAQTRIEMRINGLLYPVATLSRDEGISWLMTIYQSMSDLSDNMFKAYKPQDARLKQEFLQDVELFGARYAHINTPKGVFAVMRLIPDDGSAPPSLETLGFLPAQIAVIHAMLASPDAIIINSGPTGSGKSTTGRSFMALWLQHGNGQRRIITQEDPVEGEVEGAIHTSVTADRSSEEDINLAWLRGRRAMLRLDPDAVYIGEIRDHDSAMAAINFAESGHIVLTTQHANSPLGNLNRLQIIGVPQGFLRSSRLFQGLIAQRLLPTLCPHCARTREEAGLTPEQQQFTDRWFTPQQQEALRFRNPDGCSECIRPVMGTATSHGLQGRTVAAEVMKTSPEILRTYHDEGEDAARTLWLRQGGISLSQHARHHVLAGQVDPFMANDIVPFEDANAQEAEHGQ